MGRKGREDLFVIGYRRRDNQQDLGLPFCLRSVCTTVRNFRVSTTMALASTNVLWCGARLFPSAATARLAREVAISCFTSPYWRQGMQVHAGHLGRSSRYDVGSKSSATRPPCIRANQKVRREIHSQPGFLTPSAIFSALVQSFRFPRIDLADIRSCRPSSTCRHSVLESRHVRFEGLQASCLTLSLTQCY